MPVRQPVVAGRFYPGNPEVLRKVVREFLTASEESALPGRSRKAWGCMLPHAGYVFSGAVAGATLDGLTLPRRLIILCPNHTGRGQPLAVWPAGAWLTPLGQVPVDEALAGALTTAGGGFSPDTHAHLGEHSIEVVLPFLQLAARAPFAVVPVCVGTRHPGALARAGGARAGGEGRPPDPGLGRGVGGAQGH